MGPEREASDLERAQAQTRGSAFERPPPVAFGAALGNRSLARLARATGPGGALPSALARRAPLGNRATIRALQRELPEGGVPVEAGPGDAGAPAGAPPVDAGAPAPAPADAGPQPAPEPGGAATESGPAPSCYTAKTSATRDDMVARCAALVPATEPEKKFYDGVPKSSIDSGREWAAKRGTTYTDCIDYMGLRVKSVKKAWPPVMAPTSSKAWVAASAGMDPCTRPSPGDVFVMHSGKGGDPKQDSGSFAHTGIVQQVSQPAGGGAEQWTSIDGGQGTATQLAHKQVVRDYDPATNVFGGRFLFGWFDLDLL